MKEYNMGRMRAWSVTYLALDALVSRYLIRENSLDSPPDRLPHLRRIIHSPDTDFLPCVPTLFHKLLTLRSHEDGKVQREP